jgi:ABC-type lipoprotein release transport system permease subunit
VDDLFGLSMDYIMVGLLAALGVSLASIGYVALRNRIMFRMGLRNMPRRVAQTVLIVIGLMLSTLIISAAFTTGDTVDYSLSNTSYTLLGHVDEAIYRQGEGGAPNQIESTIPQDVNDSLRAALEAADDPNIDGYLPTLFEQVPILNPESGLSEPNGTFAGLDADSLDGFPDIVSATTGDLLDLASLADDEAFINESAADELAAEPGDRARVFVQGLPHEFTIADVVEDRFTTGVGDFEAQEGLVTRLDTLQKIFDRPGEVNVIAISNKGGVRDSVDLTDDVAASLERIIAAEGLAPTSIRSSDVALEVENVKQDLVEDSEAAGNIFATFFLVFGLFSIAAGMLLIVMIFVMLAAERKPEMGMARAVGTKRGHLIQMFMSEGMAYNVLSAMVGAGLGILIAFGIAEIMARIFSDFGLNIQPHVTLRSIVISYSLGVVLTYLTVVFSSWRVSNLNIVAAIRDLPEAEATNPEQATWIGYLRGVLNAFVAAGVLLVSLIAALRFTDLAPLFLIVALLGLVGPWLYLLRGHNFSAPAEKRLPGRRIPRWPLLALPFYLAALLLVWISRDRRPRHVPAWLIVLGIVVAPLGLLLVALQDRERPIAWAAGFGTVGVVVGVLFMQWGLASDLAFAFALGFSLVFFGAAMVLRFFGLPARLVFTVAGALVVVAWGLFAGNRLKWLVGDLEGDIEMFFLSGVAMVAASTFVLIYNADLVLAALSRLGGLFGAILPAMKTAVAYPLAYKFRTGMTLAMISLVVFALTVMSTMNLNFDRLFLADTARGGWDVIVDENPNNPIDDLPTVLRAAGSDAPESFRAVGRVALKTTSVVAEVDISNLRSRSWNDYPVLGVDDGFVDGGDIRLTARAREFDSDEAVWEAMKGQRPVAIVDGFTVQSGGLFQEDTFSISAIEPDDTEFDPVPIEVLDEITGRKRVVDVIGVIDFGASATFFGVYIQDEVFAGVFGEPDVSRHYVGLQDPGDSKAVAQDIEASLLTTGVQSESLKQRIDDQQALGRNFFLLMQGFMGLGLFVGIAAVGVIAFRTVVERRQQIGMLRAIGYKRSTVALSFILESSFITLLAVLSGVALALWLSFFLITSDEFPSDLGGFFIPWNQIVFISLFTYGASLLMTLIPSRQAASVPTAEALRYE